MVCSYVNSTIIMEEKYIASLDVGTTTVRCHIFNSSAESIGSSSEQVIY